MLLKYLLKGLNIVEDTVLPEIFLNMIPDALSEGDKSDIIGELLQCYEQGIPADSNQQLTDNVITELPFASELIHLTSMHQIFQNLSGRGIYLQLEDLIKQNYDEKPFNVSGIIKEESRDVILHEINKLASSQLTAEGNADFDVLMTEALKYLSRKYNDSVPATVVMGAKGSGKTFLYRKMSESSEWSAFCKSSAVRGSIILFIELSLI